MAKKEIKKDENIEEVKSAEVKKDIPVEEIKVVAEEVAVAAEELAEELIEDTTEESEESEESDKEAQINDGSSDKVITSKYSVDEAKIDAYLRRGKKFNIITQCRKGGNFTDRGGEVYIPISLIKE